MEIRAAQTPMFNILGKYRDAGRVIVYTTTGANINEVSVLSVDVYAKIVPTVTEATFLASFPDAIKVDVINAEEELIGSFAP